MDVVTWVLSGVLAVAMLGAGAMKVSTPHERLRENPRMAWAGDFSPAQVRLIGVLEVLAAVGLVLPWLLDVLPVLTPLAATGVLAVMAGAVVVHARRREPTAIPPPAVLMALAAAVAVLRFAQL